MYSVMVSLRRLVVMALVLVWAILSATEANAQLFKGKDQYQGSHAKNRQANGTHKRKKYKNLKGSAKRQVKQRNKTTQKRRNSNINRSRKVNKYHKPRGRNSFKGRGKKKSLYSYNNKKKGRGHYPKSKSELNSKISIGASVGGVMTDYLFSSRNGTGSVNAFTDYWPNAIYSLEGYYNHTSKLSIVLKGYFVPLAFKEKKGDVETKRQFMSSGVALGLKYHLISGYNTFSPYFVGEASYSFGQISAESTGQDYNRENGDQHFTFDKQDDSEVQVNRVEIDPYNAATAPFGMFGYRIGIGTDIKLKKSVKLFCQFEFNSNFTKDIETVHQTLPTFISNSNMNYYTFSVGVKIDMMKSSKLY